MVRRRATTEDALNIDLKLGLSEQHLEALVTLLDRNNDGEISYNELSEMLTPFTKKHPIKPNLSKSDIDSPSSTKCVSRWTVGTETLR